MDILGWLSSGVFWTGVFKANVFFCDCGVIKESKFFICYIFNVNVIVFLRSERNFCIIRVFKIL